MSLNYPFPPPLPFLGCPPPFPNAPPVNRPPPGLPIPPHLNYFPYMAPPMMMPPSMPPPEILSTMFAAQGGQQAHVIQQAAFEVYKQVLGRSFAQQEGLLEAHDQQQTPLSQDHDHQLPHDQQEVFPETPLSSPVSHNVVESKKKKKTNKKRKNKVKHSGNLEENTEYFGDSEGKTEEKTDSDGYHEKEQTSRDSSGTDGHEQGEEPKDSIDRSEVAKDTEKPIDELTNSQKLIDEIYNPPKPIKKLKYFQKLIAEAQQARNFIDKTPKSQSFLDKASKAQNFIDEISNKISQAKYTADEITRDQVRASLLKNKKKEKPPPVYGAGIRLIIDENEMPIIDLQNFTDTIKIEGFVEKAIEKHCPGQVYEMETYLMLSHTMMAPINKYKQVIPGRVYTAKVKMVH